MNTQPPKRPWWKTTLKAAALLAALILSLAVFAAVALSWTGRHDWARVKADLTTRGEPLLLATLMPPPIPDTRNFFADPMWDELADMVDAEENGIPLKRPRLPKGERQLDGLDRQLTAGERETLRAAFPEFMVQDNASIMTLIHPAFEAALEGKPSEQRRTAEFILAVTDLTEPILSRLRVLAERPDARFGPGVFQFLESLIDNTSYHMRLVQLLQARIWSEVTLGRTEEAHRDLVLLLRIPNTLVSMPFMITGLIYLATETLALDTLESTLSTGGWTESQLKEIEHRLAGANYPSAVATALRGERGFQNQFFEQLTNKNASLPDGSPAHEMWSGPIPSLWLSIFGAGEEARRNSIYQNWIDVLDVASSEGLNARTFDVFNRDIKSLKDNWWNRFRYPTTSIAIPNINAIAIASAQLQDKAAQARTACALERYRLKLGEYPSELASLVPEFLPVIPTDISTLRPLIYRREGSGFQLWAPGWNEQNDEGAQDDGLWGKANAVKSG